jgi:hypothetical protein
VTAQPATFNIVGLSPESRSGTYQFARVAGIAGDAGGSDLVAFCQALVGATGQGISLIAVESLAELSYGLAVTPGSLLVPTYKSYTDGNYYRDITINFNNTQFNFSHKGWILTVAVFSGTTNTSHRMGFGFRFDGGEEFTKASTHRLVLDGSNYFSRFSVGRA